MRNTSRMNASITHLRRIQPKPKAPEDAGMTPARHAEAFMLIFCQPLRKLGGMGRDNSQQFPRLFLRTFETPAVDHSRWEPWSLSARSSARRMRSERTANVPRNAGARPASSMTIANE